MLLSMNFVGARNSVLRHQPRYLKLLLRVEFPRVANSFGRRSAAGEGRCDRQITTTRWLAGSQSFFKDFLDLALRSHLLHLIGVDQNGTEVRKVRVSRAISQQQAVEITRRTTSSFARCEFFVLKNPLGFAGIYYTLDRVTSLTCAG